jgi:hypothetical protein
MLRPAGCSSDGAARARVGVPTRSGGPCAAPSPGAAAGPVAALAMAGAGHRIEAEVRAWAWPDATADHHGRQVTAPAGVGG